MTKKLQPKLRFRGFTDDWEQRKLKDLHKQPLLIEPIRTATYLSWSVPAFNDGVPEIARGSEIASVKQSVGFGDVLLCRINPRINRVWVVEPVGNANFPMIASTEWVVFANEDGDSHFLSALFSSDRFRNMLLSEVAGVTGSQKRFQVASVLQHEESFPSKLEQKRIGALFSKLDQLIAAEKRTLNLLKDKKTALLRQIFNQETRFKSYDRPWEQRKLGEIAEVVGGGTPDTNNPSYWNGSINWFTPAEIGSSTYVADSKRKITEKGLQHSSASLLPAYRTILFTSRASIGLVAILTTDACTNQGFQSLVASDQVDVFFLYSLCDRIKRQAVRNAAGSTFLEVSGKQLAKIPVQVPSLAEQRRIGELFQVIDALIAAKSQKIDLLELKKKSLLQQMFV
ncbi:restriction endonuclease subunit S [Bifidobacterium animalis]|uniref:restriction endonuclease subunit S n=2 Tax=Bifidobacterium animalis TaxID=28025 RepID=UPI001C3F1149|nr:restriction endonuclease subunit S [Bifidobacterium animalis]